jgi:hypothetical protein
MTGLRLREIFAANLKPGDLLVGLYAPSGRVVTLANGLMIGDVAKVTNDRGFTVEIHAKTESGLGIAPHGAGEKLLILEATP